MKWYPKNDLPEVLADAKRQAAELQMIRGLIPVPGLIWNEKRTRCSSAVRFYYSVPREMECFEDGTAFEPFHPAGR